MATTPTVEANALMKPDRHCRYRLLMVTACAAALLCAEALPALAFLRPAPQSLQHDGKPPVSGGPSVPVEESPARRALRHSEFYDPANPDLPRLQRYGEATAELPKDRQGFTDWTRALNEGRIAPRSTLAGTDAPEPELLDLDVVMRNTRDMPWVRFPHRSHTQWLACMNCHPKPFEQRAGASRISMADIFRGRFCGLCHDRVAFITFFSCERCHSLSPQPGSR